MQGSAEAPTGARDYLALNIAWGGAVAGLLRGSSGTAPPGAELPVLGLAAFTLSKAVAKEKIGAWAREPVVHHTSDGERQPRGRGLRYAVGELVTCSRCLGTWSSLGLVGLRVARPREGQIVASVLAAAALNDFLQSGFTALCNASNRQEAEARRAEDGP